MNATLLAPAGADLDPLAGVFADLSARAAALADEYRRGDPYPHIVLDDFLPADLAAALADEFPDEESPVWQQLPGYVQHNKRQLSDDARMPAGIRSLIYALNSGAFLTALEEVTGVANLVADAKLVGGGLHQTLTGGKLDVHIDYSHHPGNRLNRRLNLLIYLTPDWRDEWGGDFELWDAGVTRCVKRVAPRFNRAVIFSTTPTSYHGQPEPLACPPGRSRRSVALYYYTNGRPEESGPVVEHNTLFERRPGDPLNLRNWLTRVASGGTFRDLCPPLLYRWIRAAWNARMRTGKKA